MSFDDSGLFTLHEFKNRGVIKLAPDALVYISGKLGEAVVAPVSGKTQTVSFNDGITSISVQNNVEPPGSSNANIEITTPIYGEHSKYWTKYISPEGRNIRIPFFVPMMEVRIYFKGRYLVNGQPKYYPAFWGFIVNVEENFSGGVYKINLQCGDMLYWWHFITVNIHPDPAALTAMGGGLDLTHFSTIFHDANPYSIIYRMVKGLGVHEFVVPTWKAQLTPLGQIYPILGQVAEGIMQYWNQRFSNVGSLLRMYGMNGEEIVVKGPSGEDLKILRTNRSRDLSKPHNSDQKLATFEVEPNENYQVDDKFLKSSLMADFEVFFEFNKMGEFVDSEYMNKLDIVNEVRNKIDYEFYQDVNGDWIFKPPFYNMNTKYSMPYRIEPHEILSSGFGTNADAITTVLEINTPMHKNLRSEGPQNVGFHMDIDLARKYGIIYRRQNIEWIRTGKGVNIFAAGHLSFINAKATTGSVSIPGRPELRLGFPIYMVHRDTFHYVSSINHAFDYGGGFTTTLSLMAERPRIYNYDTNEWPKEPRNDQVFSYLGAGEVGIDLNLDQNEDQNVSRELKRSTGRITSLRQGRYEIRKRSNSKEIALTETTLPYTDEEGYRVIGALLYGRGFSFSTTTSSGDITDKIVNPERPDVVLQNQKSDSITQSRPSGVDGESAAMAPIIEKQKQGADTMVPPFLDNFNTQADSTATNDPKGAEQLNSAVPEGSERETVKPTVNNPTGE